MYLADRDIRELLPDLGIATDHPDYPFEDGQIQPCSIDLRLSNVFWQPRRRAHWIRRVLRQQVKVDLRTAHKEKIEPHRDWRETRLTDASSITIRPGQVLMGRIYERFSIPPKHAGKIEGRSSFARLGLAVHCTGDFINPGWEGYMPLQLFNASPFPIRVLPYLPVCQLMIVPLTSESEKTYGPELESKYVNDDGGPSYWWRDKRVEAVHERLGAVNVPDGIQNEIVDLVRFKDPALLGRFEKFVAGQKLGRIDNADALLDGFAQREDRRRLADKLAIAPLILAFALSVASAFTPPFGAVDYLLWGLTLLAIAPAVYSMDRRDAQYLGRREVAAARADHATRGS